MVKIFSILFLQRKGLGFGPSCKFCTKDNLYNKNYYFCEFKVRIVGCKPVNPYEKTATLLFECLEVFPHSLRIIFYLFLFMSSFRIFDVPGTVLGRGKTCRGTSNNEHNRHEIEESCKKEYEANVQKLPNFRMIPVPNKAYKIFPLTLCVAFASEDL
jgi:hypothetical protein